MFVKGEKYIAYKGNFTVLDINNDLLSIQYDKNGNDFDNRVFIFHTKDKKFGLDWFKKMVISCMEKKYKTLRVKNGSDVYVTLPYDEDKKQKMYVTYGFLSKQATFISQVPPTEQSIKLFDKKYYDIVGVYPDKNKNGYSYCSEKTWSPTIRIRWDIGTPKTIDMTDMYFGYDVSIIEYQYKNEVNCIALGWHLLELGFDILGNNHNIEAILDNIPPKYTTYFEKGVLLD